MDVSSEKEISENINENLASTPDLDDLAVESAKRVEVMEKKRRTFQKISKIFKIVFIVFVSIALIAFISNVAKKEATPEIPKFVTVPNNNSVVDPVKPSKEWTLLRDDALKIFLTYPPESSVTNVSVPSTRVDISYEKNAQGKEITESSLKDGYIFRVTPLNITIQDLDKVASIKRDSFKLKCPETAEISGISKILVDAVDARTFNISKCDVDYQVTYIPRYGIYYELLQVYKGDIGVKQQYKAVTDEIFLSFRFFPNENEIPPAQYTTYINEQFDFLFRHPNLSPTCCVVPLPLSQSSRNIITLGRPETFKDELTVDGIGIYSDTYSSVTSSFEQYMAKQQLALEDQYKVVMGREAEKTVETIKVGALDGILLKGYSWKGNDLIFVKLPAKGNVLILSTKNTNDSDFKNVMNDVINSFEFF